MASIAVGTDSNQHGYQLTAEMLIYSGNDGRHKLCWYPGVSEIVVNAVISDKISTPAVAVAPLVGTDTDSANKNSIIGGKPTLLTR